MAKFNAASEEGERLTARGSLESKTVRQNAQMWGLLWRSRWGTFGKEMHRYEIRYPVARNCRCFPSAAAEAGDGQRDPKLAGPGKTRRRTHWRGRTGRGRGGAVNIGGVVA
jgi:hypothetical protein